MCRSSNTALIGRLLYTDYILPFQAAGLILLVAMIGAIVLTLRDKTDVAAAGHRDAGRPHVRSTRWSWWMSASGAGVAGCRNSPAEARGAGGDRRAQRSRGAPLTCRSVLGHYLIVGALLLVLGIFGIFLNRKNVIVILMSIELILLAVNINLVAFSAALGDLQGQIMAMFVLTVAAAEAAIGLAIVVIYFRNRGSIAVEDVTLMKG